jgi:hypothetical protein
MYIIRMRGLKQELATGAVDARGVLPYVIANVSLWIIFSGIPDFGYEEADTWEISIEFAVACLQAVLAALGIWWFYRCNGGHSGSDFLVRLSTLGFVLTVRFALLILVATALAFAPFIREIVFPTSWETLYAYGLAIAALFWVRLGAHVRQIASLPSSISHL